MPQGLYLYCLARRDRLPPSPLVGRGLDGQNPLEVAIFQDLAAVWSPVPVEDFCGPEAEATARGPDLDRPPGHPPSGGGGRSDAAFTRAAGPVRHHLFLIGESGKGLAAPL